MAEIWGAVALGVATVGSAAYSANAAKRAGAAGARGAADATSESARQYDQTRADEAPYRTTGTGALNQLGRLFGLPTTTPEQFTSSQDKLVGDAYLPSGVTGVDVGGGKYNAMLNGQLIGQTVRGGPNGHFIPADGVNIDALRQTNQQSSAPATPAGPDMSAFFQSPGYNFTRSEGNRGIEASFAARGGGSSGNALKALAEFNSGLASQEFGNYVNQLGTIAGIGSASTARTDAAGANYADAAGRNALYAGASRASGVEGAASAINNGINQLGGIAGYYKKQKPKLPPTVTGYGGGGYNLPGVQQLYSEGYYN